VASRIGPSYRHVADDIKARITADEFPVGSPIPSTAKLMEHYSVSSTVVRHAVADLQAEGVVIGHSGKAVFVQARPSEVEAERAGTEQLAEEIAGLRGILARLEANLMDLYGKSGYEYPHEEAGRGGQEETGRHERLA
jgi:DNA-binding GntR family transcriptional regulator